MCFPPTASIWQLSLRGHEPARQARLISEFAFGARGSYSWHRRRVNANPMVAEANTRFNFDLGQVARDAIAGGGFFAARVQAGLFGRMAFEAFPVVERRVGFRLAMRVVAGHAVEPRIGARYGLEPFLPDETGGLNQ